MSISSFNLLPNLTDDYNIAFTFPTLNITPKKVDTVLLAHPKNYS